MLNEGPGIKSWFRGKGKVSVHRFKPALARQDVDMKFCFASYYFGFPSSHFDSPGLGQGFTVQGYLCLQAVKNFAIQFFATEYHRT